MGTGRTVPGSHEEIPDPDVPDSSAIIGFDPDSQAYTQHYFDSRGVARVYAMTFSEGVWTLLRETPDFTPLDFSQRFTGTFRDDAKTIAGRWESRTDASSWEHDFDLTYTKVSQPATRVPSAGSFLWPAGAWCRRLRG